jgi:hypothetical protein
VPLPNLDHPYGVTPVTGRPGHSQDDGGDFALLDGGQDSLKPGPLTFAGGGSVVVDLDSGDIPATELG